MRVIVCGSRDWTDGKRISDVLAWYVRQRGPFTVVHGGARGADRLAGEAARSMALEVDAYPLSDSDWKSLGKMAGHIRNQAMLDSGADLVLAFKDGFNVTLSHGGTENMVKIALQHLVPVVIRDSNGRVEL